MKNISMVLLAAGLAGCDFSGLSSEWGNDLGQSPTVDLALTADLHPAVDLATPAKDIAPPDLVPGNCNDGVQNGLETDVDCGGQSHGGGCGGCPVGKHCLGDKDCASGYCLGDICAIPPPADLAGNCNDGVQNGLETDVDCGGQFRGGGCGGCPVGKKCLGALDCAGGNCINGVCI